MELLKTHQKKDEKVRHKIQKENVLKTVLLYSVSVYFNQKMLHGFPESSVVKDPPANAEDMSSIPDSGGAHMPQSN